ncbi:MAG: hypothetical protein JW920_11095 [Deltaproteobacteria bacterium]|nr:hypothetical protein [Deltaproteobacteria bacterium]
MKAIVIQKTFCRLLFLILIPLMLAGCALIRPHSEFDETTPIDWGLAGVCNSTIRVEPFLGQDEKWGAYAQNKMQEYLLTQAAFTKVVRDEIDPNAVQYELRGEITHLFYGGTELPSEVQVSVRVIDLSDLQTIFFRKSAVSYQNWAVNIWRISRLFVPSPLPEELLGEVLHDIARDIAVRTRQPLDKHPRSNS